MRNSDRLRYGNQTLLDEDSFEKIRPQRDGGAFPVASRTRATSSSRKTIASKRANKRIAKNAGGMHRRRNKRVD